MEINPIFILGEEYIWRGKNKKLYEKKMIFFLLQNYQLSYKLKIKNLYDVFYVNYLGGDRVNNKMGSRSISMKFSPHQISPFSTFSTSMELLRSVKTKMKR